jgi:hypothetical protein
LIALISNAHLRKLASPALCRREIVLLLLGTVNTAYRKTSCIEIDPNQGLRSASQGHRARTRPIPHDDKRRENPPRCAGINVELCRLLHVTGVSLLHDVKMTAASRAAELLLFA